MSQCPAVLDLSRHKLFEVDPNNIDEVRNIWAAFSKAKDCITDGERFEYISWRLYSREILVLRAAASAAGAASVAASAPKSSLDMGADASDEVVTSTRNLNRIPAVSPPPSHTDVSKFFEQRKLSSQQLYDLFEPPTDVFKPGLANSPVKRQLSHSTLAVSAYQNIYGPQGFPPTGADFDTPPSPPLMQMHKRSSETLLDFIRKSPTPSNAPRAAPTGDDASQAIRGFSPSHVSISVNRSSPSLLHPTLPSVAKNALSRSVSQEVLARAEVEHQDLSRPANMFFIKGGSDSDSDADSAAVEDKHSRSSRTHLRVAFAQDVQIAADVHQDNESDWTSMSPSASSEPSHLSSNDQGSGRSGDESDEWDDVDDQDDIDDVEKDEATSHIFEGRSVPLNPSVKPSLLSNLFLNEGWSHANKQENNNPAGRASVEAVGNQPGFFDSHDSAQSGNSFGSVSAPIDILLNAHVAGHVPFDINNSDCFREDLLDFELSESLRNNIMQSRNFNIDSLWRKPNEQGKLIEGISKLRFDQQIHSGGGFSDNTARPELIRSITAPTVYQVKTSTVTDDDATPFSNSWSHDNDDIYDPLNYHSRGW